MRSGSSLVSWWYEVPARRSVVVYITSRALFAWLIVQPLGGSISATLRDWGPTLSALTAPGGELALEVWTQQGEALMQQVVPTVAFGFAFGFLSLVPLCLVLAALTQPNSRSLVPSLPLAGSILPHVLWLGLATWVARLLCLFVGLLLVSLFAGAIEGVTSELGQDAALCAILLLSLTPQLYITLLSDAARLTFSYCPEKGLLQALRWAQNKLRAANIFRLAGEFALVWTVSGVPAIFASGYPSAVGPGLLAALLMVFGKISWMSRLRGVVADATLTQP